jgi:hypothetical protein
VAAEAEWLRVRGIGRERFAGTLADYLGAIGYTVERSESTEPAETRLSARLTRSNPAVPASAHALAFRLYPTSGGAALAWVSPTEVVAAERARFDRLVRELVAHLERTVLTESHATAKVSRAPDARLPWEAAR